VASVVFHNQAGEHEGPRMKLRKPSSRKGNRVSSRTKERDPVPIDLKEAARRNKILAALPAGEFDRLVPNLETVPLKLNEVLYLPGERIEHVYFLTSGIVSLLTMLEDGTTIEVAVVGSEGMVGLSILMGVEKSANEALVQAEGLALRMSAVDLRTRFNKESALRDLLMHYIHLLLTTVSQNAACNRMHNVEERLARWLLLTHDRVGKNDFVFTQEFMSHMLGVRRAGVSVAANTLRRAGLIDYQRGEISVLNRLGLEDASCECYRTIEALSDGFHKA
jgi:CRP-like cAMP-binding protein